MQKLTCDIKFEYPTTKYAQAKYAEADLNNANLSIRSLDMLQLNMQKLNNIIYTLSASYDTKALYDEGMTVSMLDNIVDQAVDMKLDSANVEEFLLEFESETTPLDPLDMESPQIEDEEQKTIELFTPKPNIEE